MVKSITGRRSTRIVVRRLPRLAALTGSFVRFEQRTDRARPSSGLQTQSQIGYPQQIVSPGHEIGPGLRPFHPAIATAPQSAHCFHPPKDFFHPFANALAAAVTSTTGRATVQTVNLGSVFARRVRRDFPRPAPGDNIHKGHLTISPGSAGPRRQGNIRKAPGTAYSGADFSG